MTDKPEVAAGEMIRQLAYARQRLAEGDTTAAMHMLYTAADYIEEMHTHPLVVPEREVLRELVRLLEGPAADSQGDEWESSWHKTLDAARALLREDTSPVSTNPAGHDQAKEDER